MINKLPTRTLGLLTIGQLPSSYRESMSYEEQVLWLCNVIERDITPALNEVIDTLNNIDLDFTEIYDKLAMLENDITILNNEYNTINSKVNENTQAISDLDTKFTNAITEVDSTLRELINSNFNTLKDYVDYNDTILNNKIDNISTTGIMAYNPTNGLLEPLQKVLNDIAQLTNRDGLTATEFDGLELTATGFDAYQITAYEFDSQGKIILV